MEFDNLKQAIRGMFAARDGLHRAFPKRHFTPDGRMVGDIGEAIAELSFDVIIDEKLRRDWDGVRRLSDGNFRNVQVKATSKNESYLKRPPNDGDLLVIQIRENGECSCIYNGPILRVWDALDRLKADATKSKLISLKELRRLDAGVSLEDRIPKRV